MKPENIIIGLFLLSGIVLGFTFLVGELSSDYDKSVDTGFNATYGKIGEITNKTQELANSTKGNQLTSAFEISAGGLSVISLLWDSLELLNTMLGELSVEIGLPTWFIGIVIGSLTVILIFIIINYTFRYEPRG